MSGGVFHESMMRRALVLAASAPGRIAPNPRVGAVIVKEGKVISEGAHLGPGSLHAEAAAIADVREKAGLKGASIYVNLEPCAHFGRTPPCADAIINSGIKEAFIACGDPNPAVAGRGADRLRAAGVCVHMGLLEKESRNLNRRFLTFHEKNRPYIILKWAQTGDGFIARSDGSSKWISSEKSRTLTHSWRASESAVMVGRNTAIIDNPSLTTRFVPGPNPVRAVLDQNLNTPRTHNLFDGAAQTIIFNGIRDGQEGTVSFVKLDYAGNAASQALSHLHKLDLTSIIIEGGAALLKSFIEQNLWDEARVFRAQNNFVEGIAAPKIGAAIFLKNKVGTDELCIYANESCGFQPTKEEFSA